MKVCHFINKYIKPRISNTSGTLMLSDELSILGFIEAGLTRVYNFHARGRESLGSWQLKTEAFPTGQGEVYLQTKYPILDIKAIYCGKKPRHVKFKKDCECDPCGPCEYGVSCTCDYKCASLDLKRLSPGAKPCPNSYHIVDGETGGGYRGQVIGVYLPEDCCDCDEECDGLFVEYRAGFNSLDCLDDEINLPTPYLIALTDFVISDINDSASDSKETKAANAYTRAKDTLFATQDGDRKYDSKNGLKVTPILGKRMGYHYAHI